MGIFPVIAHVGNSEVTIVCTIMPGVKNIIVNKVTNNIEIADIKGKS